MSTSLRSSTRNKALDALTTDAGTTGYLAVWTGAPPAKSSNAYVVNPNTLLASFALPNPIAPGSAIGVLTLSAITNVTALASGTPGCVRLQTAVGEGASAVNVIGQWTAGVGSGDFNFASTIASGGTAGLTSVVMTEGNA